MRRFRAILLLAAVLPALVSGQTKQEAVKKVLEDYVSANGVVGGSVAVLEADGTMFSVGAGFQDREGKVPATERTIYRLASISKPVTAIAAMKMVESGKLSLFSYVGTHVPEWPDKSAHITLRHLLTHTSGVRHYLATRRDTYFDQYTVTRSLDVFKDDPLLFKPGARVSYSTHAFSLVARMVETSSGEDFASFIKAHISAYAKAPTLALEDRSVPHPDRTTLYDKIGDVEAFRTLIIENISWKAGGGGMESSAPDLARFGMAVLKNELTQSHTTEFMFQPQTIDGLQTGRGLGWALDAQGNPEHGGAQQGCRTFMKIDRQTQTVFVVMTNTGGSHPIGQLISGVVSAWKSASA